MSELQEKLNGFRAGIDAIDDELIALLNKRSAIVSQVGQLKREHQGEANVIRPGREAIMTREIVKKDAGKFPPAMLAAIWRLLIAGSTSIEQELSASVYSEGQNREFFWLAHEYFGPAATITTQATAGRVIGDVADGVSKVGLIPMPQDDPEHWWRSLISSRPHWPQVFAIAPFLADDSLPDALLVGDIVPEETGDDISLIVLETSGPLSRDRLHSIMKQEGYDAHCLTQAASDANTAHTFYVLTVEGYIPRDDVKLDSIRKAFGEPVEAAYSIGCFATQLDIDESV